MYIYIYICITAYMCISVYIYIPICVYIYIYIEIDSSRGTCLAERYRSISCLRFQKSKSRVWRSLKLVGDLVKPRKHETCRTLVRTPSPPTKSFPIKSP